MAKLKTDSVVCLNSGGLDSLVMMALMADTFKHVHSLFIDHNHQSNDVEYYAAENIAKYYGAKHTIDSVDIDSWRDSKFFENPLTKNPRVPNRNFIMFSIAASYCDSLNIPNIALAWDGHYKNNVLKSVATDTHSTFVKKLNEAFDSSSRLAWEYQTSLRIYAPLLNKTKPEIAAIGIEYKCPFELSWSCYSGGLDRKECCGKCLKCKERAKLVKLGVPNNYLYEPDVTKGKITT